MTEQHQIVLKNFKIDYKTIFKNLITIYFKHYFGKLINMK